jgi:small subunit ribosomal protein S6
MRSYEIMFIAHPELDDNSLTGLLERARGWVAAVGGEVRQLDVWGRRRLAYPIRKQTEGQYVLMQADLEGTATRELERNMRLAEQILRFQVVRTDD